jgi:hypothetical protein
MILVAPTNPFITELEQPRPRDHLSSIYEHQQEYHAVANCPRLG